MYRSFLSRRSSACLRSLWRREASASSGVCRFGSGAFQVSGSYRKRHASSSAPNDPRVQLREHLPDVPQKISFR
ncbi:hypothetical protein BS329_29965 [Amycolatopsis coloradensis]|uniref:Uncharacterized protein n=1 Tax=Amycolatopsis coloradensis TaxID=76021 RepID=A0A1R0KK08_9PSEU|nr:hypothetical protein BS329_29965 [Amycolatopsis coloradensis]